MFGKIAVLIVSAGLCASALLAARQMRTQAAYELAQARMRAFRVDENVARVRADIAARVSPQRVLEMASRSNPLKPLAAERRAPAPNTPRIAHNPSERQR